MTANLTQRHYVDAIGNPRRPIPTQEFGQFFEKRRALQWRRRTRMDSSIHPCSRIWTVLGQGRPHLIGRRAGGCEHPSLLKNLDSSEWGHSYLGDRRAGCFQQPSLIKNSANGRVWATRGRQLATAAESRHAIMSDASAPSPKSTPLCDSRLALSTGMSTCCSSRRRRDLAAPSRAFALPPFPAQEFGGRMCWTARRQCGLEEYVPLRYSSPSSVYSFRLAPHTSLLKNLDGGPLLSRATASPG